jgi:hypothetical protein
MMIGKKAATIWPDASMLYVVGARYAVCRSKPWHEPIVSGVEYRQGRGVLR